MKGSLPTAGSAYPCWMIRAVVMAACIPVYPSWGTHHDWPFPEFRNLTHSATPQHRQIQFPRVFITPFNQIVRCIGLADCQLPLATDRSSGDQLTCKLSGRQVNIKVLHQGSTVSCSGWLWPLGQYEGNIICFSSRKMNRFQAGSNLFDCIDI